MYDIKSSTIYVFFFLLIVFFSLLNHHGLGVARRIRRALGFNKHFCLFRNDRAEKSSDCISLVGGGSGLGFLLSNNSLFLSNANKMRMTKTKTTNLNFFGFFGGDGGNFGRIVDAKMLLLLFCRERSTESLALKGNKTAESIRAKKRD